MVRSVRKKGSQRPVREGCLNGQLVQENLELRAPTGHAWRLPEVRRGPLLLQADHGRWRSGIFAFDRWSDVRSGYMLLFEAKEASPKLWYTRNVNGPFRPTGICLLTVQHKAGGGDCRAEEMVSNIFHNFGALGATEPA